MRRDRLFRDSAPQDSGFKFDAKVAAVFDDMITRSVPFYVEQQRMVAEIVKQHWQPDTNIYDLGCATGTTLINLSREVSGSGRLIGYDNSASLLQMPSAKRGRMLRGFLANFVPGFQICPAAQPVMGFS